MDDAGLSSGGGEFGRFGNIDAQGLFADDVDFALQGLEYKLVVKSVRRAYVHRVQVPIEGCRQAVVGMEYAQAVGGGPGTLKC
ncbi:MAG: hypothetical protein OXO54_12575 [Chloroflexota bacterium]|nr:hypothetical protein [Chloroflexota bacterium]